MGIADIFICIAAGMFLYVAICEIMIPEFSEDKEKERSMFYDSVVLDGEDEEAQAMRRAAGAKKKKKRADKGEHEREEYKKMFCVLFGYGFMSMLAIWV